MAQPMSDQGETPEPEQDNQVDLSALSFGPAWAKPGGDKSGEPKAPRKERRERRPERGERRDDHGKRGGGRERRGDGRGQGDGGRERRFDKGGKRFDKRGGGRRDERPVREVVPAPEGVTAQVMPVEEGLDALAKQILAEGRTYAVFDLAKLVMGARERFNVGFRTKGEQRLFRCRKDGSVWLTKAEAISHFWSSPWRSDYYEEVETEADPPKGNFQAVAKCGMSGEILGPPNYHGYQMTVIQMHRERFSHMSIDAYKSRIRMERDEEVVNAWLEKMSKRLEYRPTGGKPKAEIPAKEEDAAEEAPAAEVVAGETAAPVADEAAPVADEVAPVADEVAPAGEEATEEPATEEAAAEETPAAEEAAGDEEAVGTDGVEDEAPESGESAEDETAAEPLLSDHRQVEQHFVEHHLYQAYQAVDRAWVSGGIPGNHLSPGLLTLLRDVVAEERRYPSKLTPMLCRQLSGRHVAVFKWRKKLKAGPSRPHGVPSDIILADRPRKLLDWLSEKSGGNLEVLWKDLMPEGADDEMKHLWYHDLHWVLNQGYGLLLADSTLHLAKKPEGKGGKTGAPKKDAPKADAPEGGCSKGGCSKGGRSEGGRSEGGRSEGGGPEGRGSARTEGSSCRGCRWWCHDEG